ETAVSGGAFGCGVARPWAGAQVKKGGKKPPARRGPLSPLG
ncbi:ATP synthase F0, C subunit domain protein, partial [Clostridium sp. ATCC 29733]